MRKVNCSVASSSPLALTIRSLKIFYMFLPKTKMDSRVNRSERTSTREGMFYNVYPVQTAEICPWLLVGCWNNKRCNVQRRWKYSSRSYYLFSWLPSLHVIQFRQLLALT